MAEKKTTKITTKTVLDELKTTGLVIVGVIGGNFAGKMVDKVIKVDETAEGFQMKAIVKPVLQLTTGLAGTILLQDKNMKMIAVGVAASGIASSVKVFFKKEVLNGFGDAGIKQIFREPLNLTIEPYNPDLPRINQNIEVVPFEITTSGPTDLVEYQEVGEIGIL